MGVDNEAVYVFGTSIPMEVVYSMGEEYGEYVWHDEVPEVLTKLYPNLYLGHASPHYCADDSDCTYFVSMRDHNDLGMSIEQTAALIDDWQNDTSGRHLAAQYRGFLEHFGIPYEEPSFWASPHVF